VQRPNRPMSGLEKFGLDTVSPSTINEWISYRPRFVLRKIYGYKDLPTSCAMERGNQSEYAAKLILQDKMGADEAIGIAIKNLRECVFHLLLWRQCKKLKKTLVRLYLFKKR